MLIACCIWVMFQLIHVRFFEHPSFVHLTSPNTKQWADESNHLTITTTPPYSKAEGQHAVESSFFDQLPPERVSIAVCAELAKDR